MPPLSAATKPWPSRSQRASALVTTLLVITVLTIIVVAFLQSMSIERMTSRSYANIEQARLAAEAGVAEAENLLKVLFTEFPDSATAWQRIPLSSGPTNEVTAFHFRDAFQSGNTFASYTNLPSVLDPANRISPAAFNSPGRTNVALYALPLASGALVTKAASLNSSFPQVFTNSLENPFVNLNVSGRIGPTNGISSQTFYAAWVEILLDPSRPRNLTRGSDYNPPIARYAYWVEDESFRLNLNLSGTNNLTTNSVGTNVADANLQRLLNRAGASGDQAAHTIKTLQASAPAGRFSSASQIRQTPSVSDDLYNRARFSLALDSSGLNLSRGGFKRVNLNTLFPSGESRPPNLPTQINRFVATITNTNASPLFGQRFYRPSNLQLNSTNAVSSDHAPIYLQKIAANIKDFTDSDSQPTIILNQTGFPLAPTGVPTEGAEPAVTTGSGPNPFAAVGKEAVPAMWEAVVRVTVLNMTPPGRSGSSNPGAQFRFHYDYYFEFYNPYNRDITLADLGPNPHIRVYNQPRLDTGGGTADGYPGGSFPEGRDFIIPLDTIPGLTFRAGDVTVITTDQSPNPRLGAARNRFIAPLNPDGSTFLNTGVPLLSNKTRTLSGVTRDSSNDSTSGYSPNFTRTYRVLAQHRSSDRTDYQTGYLLGNSNGLIEGFLGIALARTSPEQAGYGLAVNAEAPDRLNSDRFFNRGSSLRGPAGSETGARSGDPRSTMEPLTISVYITGGGSDFDQFRFYNLMNNANVPGDATLYALNSNFVDPTVWPDWTSSWQASSWNATQSAILAPGVIGNQPLRSIAELGSIYDPARVQGAGRPVERMRGGGRTLKIGQPERYQSTTNRFGLWSSRISDTDTSVEGLQTSASRTWTAWRLADLFSVNDEIEQEGLFNINGLRRDQGLAFEALLAGFQFEGGSNGTLTTANRTLSQNSDQQRDNLTLALIQRLNGDMTGELTNSPSASTFSTANTDAIFWERGEISEIALFNSGNQLNGANMTSTLDRGREEVFRKLIERVTVKGNTFTVYAVGEKLEVDGQGRIVPKSRSEKAVTFRLSPINADGSPYNPSDDFDPNSPQRFQRPNSYEIRQLSSF